MFSKIKTIIMNSLDKNILKYILSFLPPTSRVYLAQTCKEIHQKAELHLDKDLLRINQRGISIKRALRYDDPFMLALKLNELYESNITQRQFQNSCQDIYLDAQYYDASWCVVFIEKNVGIHKFGLIIHSAEKRIKL